GSSSAGSARPCCDDPQRTEVSQGHYHLFPPSLPIVGYSRLPFLAFRIPSEGEERACAGARPTAQLPPARVAASCARFRPRFPTLVFTSGDLLAAQAHPPLTLVDAQDFDLDLVANFDHIFGALHLVVG